MQSRRQEAGSRSRDDRESDGTRVAASGGYRIDFFLLQEPSPVDAKEAAVRACLQGMSVEEACRLHGVKPGRLTKALKKARVELTVEEHTKEAEPAPTTSDRSSRKAKSTRRDLT